MSDKSALHPEPGERNNETGTPGGSLPISNRRPAENSLLADLLSETSNEAQRELDQIKAELQSRKDAELEARRTAERQRRAELYRLREAELKRREAALRSPDPVASQTPDTNTASRQRPIVQSEPMLAIEQKKSSGPVYAIAAVLIAAIATAGWYFTTKEKAQAEVKAAEKSAAANTAPEKTPGADDGSANLGEPTAKQPEGISAAGTAGKSPTNAVPEATTPALVKRLAATESASFERRIPEFDVPKYVKSKRRTRRNRRRRGPGKGKIKIRGLNLGAGR